MAPPWGSGQTGHLPATTESILRTAATVLTVLGFAGVLGWLQLSQPRLFDGDSYFHTRAAQQLGEHGVQRRLPQAAFSTWAERYSDKDLLFHALLIPFCRDGESLRVGGKWATWTLGLGVLAALAAALHALRIRFAPVWIALFCLSGGMLYYLLKTRPHLLAMLLFPVELVCLLGGRWRSLGALAALHTWSHTSFVLVPGLALAHALAHRLLRGTFAWRGLAATGAGLALAMTLHPYLPNNLFLTWDQVVEVARTAWWGRPDLPPELFGRELGGMPPAVLARGYAALGLPLLAGAALVLGPGPARLSLRSLTLLLLTGGFVALALLSARFAAFLGLFAALAAGSLWSDRAGERPLRELLRSGAGPAVAAGLVAATLVVAAWRHDPRVIAERLGRVRAAEVYRPAIAFLDRAARPEEQVYHDFWWSFSWLYHFRPEGRYVVGLDPIFLYRADPGRFRAMRRLHEGEAADPSAILAEEFGARWVFVERLPRSAPLRGALQRDPQLARRYADRYAEIYEVLAEAPARRP